MTTQCQHYWVIETADGPISNGVCQACGETREFQNSIPFLVNGQEKTMKESKEIIEGRKRHRQQTMLVPYGLEG